MSRLSVGLVIVAVLAMGCGGQQQLSSAPADERTIRHEVIAEAAVKAEPARVSSSCEDAMRRAAAASDSERSEPLIERSLSACRSVAEWFAGLRLYPGAMGLDSSDSLSASHVQVACHAHRSTPVCSDAADLGML